MQQEIARVKDLSSKWIFNATSIWTGFSQVFGFCKNQICLRNNATGNYTVLKTGKSLQASEIYMPQAFTTNLPNFWVPCESKTWQGNNATRNRTILKTCQASESSMPQAFELDFARF